MSAAAKMRRTKAKDSKVTIQIVKGSNKIIYPNAKGLLKKVKEITNQLGVKPISNLDSDWMTADEVFNDNFRNQSLAGVRVKGYRIRDGLTQKKLGEKIGVDQPVISSIENGTRAIGKKMAMRFARIFQTDYRVFL